MNRFVCFFMYMLCSLNLSAQSIEDGIKFYENKEYSKARPIMVKAAEANNPDGQYYLAKMYYYGHGVQMNFITAGEWMLKAAGQGYIKAQHALGVMYEKGRGVPIDKAKAIYWYTKAADQGEEKSKRKIKKLSK